MCTKWFYRGVIGQWNSRIPTLNGNRAEDGWMTRNTNALSQCTVAAAASLWFTPKAFYTIKRELLSKIWWHFMPSLKNEPILWEQTDVFRPYVYYVMFFSGRWIFHSIWNVAIKSEGPFELKLSDFIGSIRQGFKSLETKRTIETSSIEIACMANTWRTPVQHTCATHMCTMWPIVGRRAGTPYGWTSNIGKRLKKQMRLKAQPRSGLIMDIAVVCHSAVLKDVVHLWALSLGSWEYLEIGEVKES